MKSMPVTEDELPSIIQALEDDLNPKSWRGVGLSGIQISIPKRVAIIRMINKVKVGGTKREIKSYYDLYNAEIIEKDQPFAFKGEGCLSIENKRVDTIRYNRIKIKNGDGKVYDFFWTLGCSCST